MHKIFILLKFIDNLWKCMNERNCINGVGCFIKKEGCYDGSQSVWPSVITEDLTNKIDICIWENNIDELHVILSKIWSEIYDTVSIHRNEWHFVGTSSPNERKDTLFIMNPLFLTIQDDDVQC